MFVNMRKDIILFLYDERGCEVIGVDGGRIGKVYDEYEDWIELE
ncbi:DUF3885 domain-containing protein [Bacillus velezensis]